MGVTYDVRYVTDLTHPSDKEIGLDAVIWKERRQNERNEST